MNREEGEEEQLRRRIAADGRAFGTTVLSLHYSALHSLCRVVEQALTRSRSPFSPQVASHVEAEKRRRPLSPPRNSLSPSLLDEPLACATVERKP